MKARLNLPKLLGTSSLNSATPRIESGKGGEGVVSLWLSTWFRASVCGRMGADKGFEIAASLVGVLSACAVDSSSEDLG